MDTQIMEKQPTSKAVIRFHDCDPLNHLNNGRYLDYFMAAREDHLSGYYNLNIYERLKEKGETWVVAKNDIVYRKPAFLMEEVLIQSQVNNYSIKHVEVEMAMFDKTKKQLKALLRTVFVPFSVSGNASVEHDKETMELLKSVHVDGMTQNIEERIAELEGSLKIDSL